MDHTHSEARERVLVAAEQLFAEKGYGPVTLRQIGAKAGLHHSSLYHHAAGGKEELFVEVMERLYARHQIAITAALQHAQPTIRAQLYALAEWLLSQPPIDLVRLEYVDMPDLSRASVERLTSAAYTALQVPIMQALQAAHARGEVRAVDFELISGGLVGMIESLFSVSEQVAGKTRITMARGLIDVMLDGLHM